MQNAEQLEEFDSDEYGWIPQVLAIGIRVIARKAGDGPGQIAVVKRMEKLGAISWN